MEARSQLRHRPALSVFQLYHTGAARRVLLRNLREDAVEIGE